MPVVKCCVPCALLKAGASTGRSALRMQAARPLWRAPHRAASTSPPSSRNDQATHRAPMKPQATKGAESNNKRKRAPEAAHKGSRTGEGAPATSDRSNTAHCSASTSTSTSTSPVSSSPSPSPWSKETSSLRARSRAAFATQQEQGKPWYERFMTALLKPVFTQTIVSCRQCGNPISTARDFAFLRTEAQHGAGPSPERTVLAAPIEGTSLFVRRDQSKSYPHHCRCKHCFNFLGRVETIPQLAATDTQSSVIFPGIRLQLQPRRVRLSITSWITGATHTLSCNRWCSLTPSEVFMTGLPLLHIPPEDSIMGYDSAKTRQFALVRTRGGLYRWQVSDHSEQHREDMHATAHSGSGYNVNSGDSESTPPSGLSTDASPTGSGGAGTREIDFETDEYRDLVQRRYGARRGRGGTVGSGRNAAGEGLFTKASDMHGEGEAGSRVRAATDGRTGSMGVAIGGQQGRGEDDDEEEEEDDDDSDDEDSDDELEKDLRSFERQKHQQQQQYASGLPGNQHAQQHQQQHQQTRRNGARSTAEAGAPSSRSMKKSTRTADVELEAEVDNDVHTRNLRPVERDLRLTGMVFGAKHLAARARARVVEGLVNAASLFPKGSMLRVLLYHEAFVRPHWHPLGVKYSTDFFREICATRDAPLSDQVVPLVHAAAAARWPLAREIDAPAVLLECLKYIFETKAEAPSTARARQQLQRHLHRLLDNVLHGAHAGRAMDVAEALARYGFEIDEAAFTCIGLMAASMDEKGINPLLELTGLSLFDVSHCNQRPQYPALQRALATSKHIPREHLQSKGLRWTLSLMLENDASDRALTLLRTVEATGMDVQTGNEALILKLVATSMEASSEDLASALAMCKTAGADIQPATLQLLSFAAPVKDGATGNGSPTQVGPAVAAVRDYLVWADSMGLLRLTKPAYARHAIRFFIGDHHMCEKLAHAATNNCIQPFTLRTTYSALLATYLAADDYERCLDVIHRIHATEKRLSISLVYSSVIKRMVRVYVKLGMLQEAVHLITDERTRQRTPLSKTTLAVSYASILEYLAENDTLEHEALGLELVRRAIKEGVYDTNLRFLDTGTLDLHDVPVGVARFLVLDFLDNMKTTRRRATIITGKGLNSPNNIPVIKPMVEALLKERGYDFQSRGHNTGKLSVNLRRKKKAKSVGHALDRVLS